MAPGYIKKQQVTSGGRSESDNKIIWLPMGTLCMLGIGLLIILVGVISAILSIDPRNTAPYSAILLGIVWVILSGAVFIIEYDYKDK